MTAKEKMVNRIKEQSTELLKEMVNEVNNDLSKESDIVLMAILDELMERMEEEDFVEFCDSL